MEVLNGRSSKEVGAALIRIISHSVVPEIMQSDNGGEVGLPLFCELLLLQHLIFIVFHMNLFVVALLCFIDCHVLCCISHNCSTVSRSNN